MARLSVTWGNPRLSVSYPAVLAGLSKLLAADLSGVSAFAPDLEQEHRLGAPLSASAGIGGDIQAGEFTLAAALEATGALAPDISHTHHLGAALSSIGAASADITVSFDLAADLEATGALSGDIQETHALGAEMAATGGLTADLDVQAAAGDPAFSAVAVAYSGTGATQSITGVGFEPEAVLILENGGGSGVERTIVGSSWGGVHWRLGINNTTENISGVTSFDADGFTLGSDAKLNDAAKTYVAICFAPGSGAETANFDALTWANSFSSKTITHGVGVAPIWAWNNQDDSTAGAEWLDDAGLNHHSVNVGDTIVAETGSVTAVSASDISVGTSSEWNGDFSGTSHMVLFGGAAVSGKYATGTYTGDGASGNAITGLGFAPSVVMIRSVDGDGASVLVDALSSNTAFDLRDGNRDSAFTLDADGFTVNGNDKINRNGETFRYFAWV